MCNAQTVGWKALKTPLDPRKTPSIGQNKTGTYLKTETPQELM